MASDLKVIAPPPNAKSFHLYLSDGSIWTIGDSKRGFQEGSRVHVTRLELAFWKIQNLDVPSMISEVTRYSGPTLKLKSITLKRIEFVDGSRFLISPFQNSMSWGLSHSIVIDCGIPNAFYNRDINQVIYVTSLPPDKAQEIS